MKTNIYFIRSKDNANLIKIGVADDVKDRLSTLQTGSYAELEVLGSFPVRSRKDAFAIERRLHDLFRCFNVRGEWFRSTNPVRELIAAVTQLEMHIDEAIEKAWADSKKHRKDYSIRLESRVTRNRPVRKPKRKVTEATWEAWESGYLAHLRGI